MKILQWFKNDAALPLLTGLLGFSAGTLLVVCGRRCVQILGPGLDAQVTGVATFGVGLILGLLIFRFCAVRFGGSPWFRPLLAVAVIAAAILGQRLAPTMSLLAASIAPLRGSTFTDAVTCGVVGSILNLLPTLGVTVLLAGLIYPPRGRSRTRLWLVIGASLSGAVLGYETTAKYLLPQFGTLPAVAIALTEIVLFLGILLASEYALQPARWLLLPVAGVLLYYLAIGLGNAYLYGYPEAGQKMAVNLFQVAESGDIRVCQNGPHQWIEIDGVPAAGDGPDLRADFALASLPRLLRPEAAQVLIIGYGTGATSGASLLYPGTRVLCAEPEPVISAAAQAFRDRSFRPAPSAHFSLASKSAKAALKSEPGKFDLVLTEYGDPRLPGVPGVFTRQFYNSTKRALSPTGILAQRLQLNSFAPEGLALVARTVLASFPYTGLLRISSSEAILLASNSPLLSGTNSVRTAQNLVDQMPPVAKQFENFFSTTNVAKLLTTHFWLDQTGLQRIGHSDSEQRLLTDWNPWAFSRLRQGVGHQIPTDEMILVATFPDVFKHTFVQTGCGQHEAVLCHELAGIFAADRMFVPALELTKWGLTLDPDQPDLLADQLVWSMEDDSKKIVDVTERIQKVSVEATARVGISLRDRKLYKEAALVLEEAVKANPESATMWANLGIDYEAAGDSARANECLARAVALDPVNEFVISSSERIRRNSLSAQDLAPLSKN